MTTVAWDGRTLAADRRLTWSGGHYEFRKIRRTADGRLLGAAGFATHCLTFLDWVEDPAGKPMPSFQEDEDDQVNALEIMPDGRLMCWARGGRVEVAPGLAAVGSGSAHALGAMHAGADACRAIEIASLLDGGTGNGVDSLALEREA